MIYNSTKFILFHFFLFTIYYLAFSIINIFNYSARLVLIIFLLVFINLLNYSKIKELLFENSMITIDFIIYDIISIWNLLWIIMLYFWVTYSAILIYIVNFWEKDLVNIVNQNLSF